MDSTQAAPPAPASLTAGIPARKPPLIHLPIVRLLAPKTGKPRLLGIYDDHIVMGACPKNCTISESMLTVEGESELTAFLHKPRRLDFNEILAIRIHPGTLFHHFVLVARSGKGMRFSLPMDQSGHVSHFLTEKLSDRVPFHRLWAGKATASLVVLLGLVCSLAALNLVHLDQGDLGALLGLMGLAVTVAGLWLLFGAGTLFPHKEAILDATQQPPQHAVATARPPLRNKPLGWMLKFLGLAYWFLLLSPLLDPFRAWLDTVLDSQPQQYVWTLLLCPAPLLIYTGYRLCQQRYIPKQSDDTRKPILFLRPFQDDEHTSLQPVGFTATASGIRSKSIRSKNGQVDMINLVMTAHPMRMLRMIANRGAGSSEETIARFFERHGPVIAIGKPGEHLASPGAARMYLDDASWQDAIIAEMQRAQAVVIQPAPSEGVRWELNHIRDKVSPCRVLFCLIGYWNNPEGYEELTTVVSETLRVDLPRVVPYLQRPAFVYFDEAWSPHVQQLSYRDPVFWPVTLDAADLKYSLGPFVEGMQGAKHQPANPTRWIGGRANWFASLGAILLGTILIVVPNAVVYLSGQAIKMAAGGESVFSMLINQSPEAVARAPKMTLHGKAVAYQMQLPDVMSAVKTDEPAVDRWYKTPDSHLDIEIITVKQAGDLANMPQQRLQATKAASLSAQLDSQREFEQAGVTWTESQITRTQNDGLSVKEIARGTNTANGLVLIVTHIVRSPDSNAVYEKLADEALQSFRFEDALPQNSSDPK